MVDLAPSLVRFRMGDDREVVVVRVRVWWLWSGSIILRVRVNYGQNEG